MSTTPYDLYKALSDKGYFLPMEGEISLEGKKSDKPGTGDRLRYVMEIDRVNVFKAYFGESEKAESSWLAGEEPGKGMFLSLWQERLIHAEVLVMQEKIESTVDYLLHLLSK